MIGPSPDFAKNLTTQPALTRRSVGHYTLIRRDDSQPHAVEDRANLVRAHVDSPARSADACEMSDGGGAILSVAQEHAQHPLWLAFDHPEVSNEAFFLQDAADLELQSRRRHVHAVVLREVRVANPG